MTDRNAKSFTGLIPRLRAWDRKADIWLEGRTHGWLTPQRQWHVVAVIAIVTVVIILVKWLSLPR